MFCLLVSKARTAAALNQNAASCRMISKPLVIVRVGVGQALPKGWARLDWTAYQFFVDLIEARN